MWWNRRPSPRLSDLQGNVLSAYRKLPHVAYTFVEINDSAGGRELLRALRPLVTTAEAGGEHTEPTLNVAITFAGLAALEVCDPMASASLANRVDGDQSLAVNAQEVVELPVAGLQAELGVMLGEEGPGGMARHPVAVWRHVDEI